VVYLATPLWAAIIAAVALQGEGMEAVGWLGAGLILLGSCVAAASPPNNMEAAEGQQEE
jgi:drug/metabolite transporter (DMT)-like permease